MPTSSLEQGPERRYLRRLAFLSSVAVLSFASLAVVATSAPTSAGSSCFQPPGTAPKIPDITATPGSSAWYEQEQASMRAELGLGAGSGAIGTAGSDPDSTSIDAGIPLTLTESQQVEAQNDFTDNIGDVDSYERGIPHSKYGGSYVDPANPLQLDVEFPADDCADFTTLQAHFGDLSMVAVVSPNGAPLRTLN